MGSFKSHLTVYFESLELLNSIKGSFYDLKDHSKFDISFAVSNHFQEYISSGDNLSIYFSAKSEDYFKHIKTQNHSLTVFANNLYYSKLYKKVNNLGFQRQICEINDIQIAEINSEFNYSLGLLLAKEELVNIELRNTQHALVDLSILPKLPLNLANNSLLTGLQLEKLIQLIANCSKSPNLKSLFFNTSNFNFHKMNELSELFSTILWYFIEGIRGGPVVLNEFDSCDKSIASMKDFDQDLEFIHQNGHYWARLLSESENLFPCTFEEYQDGILGDMSSRLFKKLIQ
jgi:hypothetical protein